MFELITNPDLLLETLRTYGEWVVFLAVFFTGETAILASFIVTQSGEISFLTVFILATLATLAADMFWFLLGRYFPMRIIPSRLRFAKNSSIITALDEMIGKRLFLTILFMKFFIGTRLAIILYCARQTISTPRFILYNSISILIYLNVLALLGIMLGRVVSNFISSYQTGAVILTAILLGLLVVLIAKKLMRQRLLQFSTRKNY